MRESKMPVDMSSEQKEILGIFSKRQLIYLIFGGLVLYTYVPLVFNFLKGMSWQLAAVVSIITAIPTVGVIAFLGFMKKEKLNMFQDFYLLIKIKRKSQYGNWRKGI